MRRMEVHYIYTYEDSVLRPITLLEKRRRMREMEI
jgi:hypothetical protein